MCTTRYSARSFCPSWYPTAWLAPSGPTCTGARTADKRNVAHCGCQCCATRPAPILARRDAATALPFLLRPSLSAARLLRNNPPRDTVGQPLLEDRGRPEDSETRTSSKPCQWPGNTHNAPTFIVESARARATAASLVSSASTSSDAEASAAKIRSRTTCEASRNRALSCRQRLIGMPASAMSNRAPAARARAPCP